MYLQTAWGVCLVFASVKIVISVRGGASEVCTCSVCTQNSLTFDPQRGAVTERVHRDPDAENSSVTGPRPARVLSESEFRPRPH